MAENKKSSIVGKSTCHLLNVKEPERVAKRLKLTFQRTKATIVMMKSERQVEATMSLLDISEGGAGLFTHELLLKGAFVELCVQEPRILKVKGIVAWSVPVKSGVQNARFAFRSGIQFVFENDVQKSAVKDFLERVNTDPLEIQKPPAHPPVSNAETTANAEPTPVAPETAAAEPAAATEPAITEQGAATEAGPAATDGPAAGGTAPAEGEQRPTADGEPPASGEGAPQAA